ncbi:MAG: glycoside hydrolase family 15 protein [Pyrinomonadaceae bacterium]
MRDIPVGNGSLLVNFDDKYQIRDFYFPHVGQENHSEGFPFRFGVWADGEFSWVFEDEWERFLGYHSNSIVTDVRLVNRELGLEITCNDMVAAAENIYLRRVVVRDLRGSPREVRIFLHHDFRIYENKVGDTAYYDPETLSLIHYKKHRYFLINTEPHFDDFATGRKDFLHQEGTWRDAEDGGLHGGPITEGSVDSTIEVDCTVDASGNFEFYYWIAAGTSHDDVARLQRNVVERGPATYFNESEGFWHGWLDPAQIDADGLSPEIVELYKRSLLIARTQIDNGGAIIAANDHDVTERATDHYSYLWPRDGAFVANAFDLAGYPEISRHFFSLCEKIVHERGYFLQKYNPDGSIGSGWHTYWNVERKQEMLPIQEDETALVLWALWEHYDKFRDVEFARDLYFSLILTCADFLVGYRDESTGLPLPSWNLWEDRRGVHTFTCSTVVAGVRAAANFARLFDDTERGREYESAANEIVVGMRRHLYSEEHGRFLRGLLANGDDSLIPDPIVDASLFGMFYFGCFDIDDPVVINTMNAVESKLKDSSPIGGVARFEHDGYMRVSDSVTGNAWFICTLWLAEYYIARAKAEDDLKPAIELLEWVTKRALPSGVLAEQIDPLTGGAVSVSPLTWSHSTFVATVKSYLAKLRGFAA